AVARTAGGAGLDTFYTLEAPQKAVGVAPRPADALGLENSRCHDLAERRVAHGGAGDDGEIVGGGVVVGGVQAVGVGEAGAGGAQFLGPGRHGLGEGGLAAGHVLGNDVGGVVAGRQHQGV